MEVDGVNFNANRIELFEQQAMKLINKWKSDESNANLLLIRTFYKLDRNHMKFLRTWEPKFYSMILSSKKWLKHWRAYKKSYTESDSAYVQNMLSSALEQSQAWTNYLAIINDSLRLAVHAQLHAAIKKYIAKSKLYTAAAESLLADWHQAENKDLKLIDEVKAVDITVDTILNTIENDAKSSALNPVENIAEVFVSNAVEIEAQSSADKELILGLDSKKRQRRMGTTNKRAGKIKSKGNFNDEEKYKDNVDVNDSVSVNENDKNIDVDVDVDVDIDIDISAEIDTERLQDFPSVSNTASTPVSIAKHILPELPFSFHSLEPFVDEKTIQIHYDVHHRTYVERLNHAEQKLLKARSDNQPEQIAYWEKEVCYYEAAHQLHCLYWRSMTDAGGGVISGLIKEQIIKDFDKIEAFRLQFTEAANAIKGNGWALLAWLPQAAKLGIVTIENYSPSSRLNAIPLLAIDLWEHAYYLKFQNLRLDYIHNWWSVVNWTHVNQRLEAAKSLELSLF